MYKAPITMSRVAICDDIVRSSLISEKAPPPHTAAYANDTALTDSTIGRREWRYTLEMTAYDGGGAAGGGARVSMSYSFVPLVLVQDIVSRRKASYTAEW